MKTKILLLIILGLTLGACSPFAIAKSSGQRPASIVESDSTEMSYQQLEVVQADAEVGVGSPIPVFVTVNGNLPDTCAQVEFMQLLQDESNFDLTLSTVPSDAEGCVQDSLPFRITLPLNVIALPAGAYTVDANGSPADFSLETGTQAISLPTVDTAFYKDDIQVDNVNIEVGQGSPIPVHAIVSLSLPSSCAQLGEMRLHRDGTTFFVRLIAYVLEGDHCQPDSIPFRAEIPLNIVNLPEGPYEVNVNGVTASFDPFTVPASP